MGQLERKPPLIEDISDLFTEIPTRIAWDNSDNENIFAFYPQNIYRINIKDKTIFLQDAARLPESLNTKPTMQPQEKFLINDKNDLLTREGTWIRIYPKEDFGTPQVYDIAKSGRRQICISKKRTENFFIWMTTPGFYPQPKFCRIILY